MGKRLLLIRRSDGTTQYLRPVTSGTGTPGAYRTVRTTQVRVRIFWCLFYCKLFFSLFLLRNALQVFSAFSPLLLLSHYSIIKTRVF